MYQKENIEYEIEKVKYLKGMVLLKLKGIEHINEAEKYKNCFLKIKREDAKKFHKCCYLGHHKNIEMWRRQDAIRQT